MLKNHRIKLLLILIISFFFIVYSLEQSLELKTTSLEIITLEDINKVIKTKANISKQTINKNHSFFILRNSQTTMNAVFFKLNKTLEKKEYEIIGKITPYQNKPQITIFEMK